MSANGLHRIRWRRVAVARVRTAARQFARDLVNIRQGIDEEGVENVGKRTPSDRHERLSKYTARYRLGGGGKCRQTDSIGSDGDGLPWQESIGQLRVSSQET